MMNKLVGLVKEEQGQGLAEYGLVLGVIAVAVIGIIAAFRDQIIDMFNDSAVLIRDRDTVAPETLTP